MHLTWTDFVDLLQQPLSARSRAPANAAAAAEITARAYGMGIRTHALRPWAAALEKAARLGPQADQVRIKELAPALGRIDGSGLLPQLALRTGVADACQRALRFGIGATGVHGAGWIGAIAPYLLDAFEQGLACMITVQASSCANCAPIGGLQPLLGTNPIGMCYGGPERGMIADFSTAVTSMGQVGELLAAGSQAPEAWFREPDGRWTDDPTAMGRGGSMTFAGGQHGGHRGFAWSLWTEAMAVLAGGHAHDADRPGSQNIFITAYASTAGQDLQGEIDRLHQQIRQSRRADTATAIRIPGERALAELQNRRSHGLEIPSEDLDFIHELSQRVRPVS